MADELKPLGPYFKGQIVGYVEREEERRRSMLSLRRFHIVQTHSQQEQHVANDIEDELGMAAYVPKVPAKVRCNSHKHRKVMRAMYPGYMFAGFDPAAEDWGKISDVEGVIRLFKIDLRPVSVPHAAMDRIREREKEEAFGLGVAALRPIGIKLGTIVRLVECGAYSGLFAPVSEINQQVGRLCVALELFGRPSAFWLNPEQVEIV